MDGVSERPFRQVSPAVQPCVRIQASPAGEARVRRESERDAATGELDLLMVRLEPRFAGINRRREVAEALSPAVSDGV